MKFGVLVSGELGFSVLRKLNANYDVSFVFTDAKSLEIIKYVREKSIPLFIGNPRNGKVVSFIRQLSCDYILSINYLFLIDEDLISLPKKLAINFHGSLLPKYRGRTPHVWSIINNEKKAGITAHIIDKDCDTGGIIDQMEVDIDYFDTGAMLLQKYVNQYWPFVENIVLKLKNDDYVIVEQDESKATFFGKRTPQDGHINWNWQKERIYNWVRAQASPYPGAFTYYKGEKIIINSIFFSDFGFTETMQNGQILGMNPFLVKTPNGVIGIASFEGNVSDVKIKSCFE